MSKKKIFRISILAVSALVLISAIIVLIVSLSSMGYKKAVKSYCNSLFTADFDSYWDSLSTLEYGGVDFDSRYTVLGETYDSYLGLISSATQAKAGEIKSVNVKFDSNEKMTDDEIDELYETYASSSAATSLDDITAGRTVDVTVTVEGSDDTVTFDINNLAVLKEGKVWRVFSLASDSNIADLLKS